MVLICLEQQHIAVNVPRKLSKKQKGKAKIKEILEMGG